MVGTNQLIAPCAFETDDPPATLALCSMVAACEAVGETGPAN